MQSFEIWRRKGNLVCSTWLYSNKIFVCPVGCIQCIHCIVTKYLLVFKNYLELTKFVTKFFNICIFCTVDSDVFLSYLSPSFLVIPASSLHHCLRRVMNWLLAVVQQNDTPSYYVIPYLNIIWRVLDACDVCMACPGCVWCVQGVSWMCVMCAWRVLDVCDVCMACPGCSVFGVNWNWNT